jgi:putative transposase
MSEAKSGLSCCNGKVPAQSYRRRKILFHADTDRSTVDRACRPCRRSWRGVPRATRQERPFAIDAIVILPDHLHAIVSLPGDDTDFPGRWRRIKGYFSSRLLHAGVDIRRYANGELALWQRRYWEHTIRNDDDFARHVDYIHYNPVKHGLVKRVCDWPYSSFHLYVRRGMLTLDWAGDAGASALSSGERR